MGTKGLVILYTGDGKGKTTAAMGLVLRAAGQGLRCCVIQFIKNAPQTGEAKALTRFQDRVEFHITGTGFTWEQEEEAVREAALEGWRLAVDKIMSGRYALVILDEVTYLLQLRILSEEQVVSLLQQRPPELHVVMTGRKAPSALLEAADLATEMREAKHPYQTGRRAQKGIEF